MKIDFSQLASFARLLAEAAETKNLALCDTWADNISAMLPAIQAAFNREVEADLKMEAVRADYSDRREFEATF